MSDYRINVRFHSDIPSEVQAAEYLKTLNKSRNKFIVDAVIAYINKESVNYENLLESIRQVFREEVQMRAEILSPPSAMSVDVKLTEEQKLENDKSVLEALDVFG